MEDTDNKGKQRHVMHIRLPPEVHEQVRIMAKRRGCSQSAVITGIIVDGIEGGNNVGRRGDVMARLKHMGA